MKSTRRIATFVVGIVAITAIAVSVACNNQAEARGVDLVDGIAPASDAFAGIHGFAEELAALPPQERMALIEKARPRLNQAVVYFLRNLDRIKRSEKVEKVELFFGSIEGTRAKDGEGKEFKGYFLNELVARVHLKGGRTEDALVRCLNLYLELPEHIAKLQRLSSTEITEVKEFTIEKGQGLIHHVDYTVAIDLAERHNLKLYRGRDQNEMFLISPDVARGLEWETGRVQVTVGVMEGDHFNLADGTFSRKQGR